MIKIHVVLSYRYMSSIYEYLMSMGKSISGTGYKGPHVTLFQAFHWLIMS